MNHSSHLNLETPSSDESHHRYRTALVLGGGGSAGNAWLIGVIAGMLEAGLDVTGADLIIGTSAGSTAAAQITSASPAQLLADILTAVPPQPRAGRTGSAPTRLTTDHLEAMKATIAASKDAADYRRRTGAALESDAASHRSMSAQWRSTVEARLPGQLWPKQQVLITAVDARSGAPVEFDRNSGVELVDAVAASCAGGFAYAIGDRRYIDGGYRSNADNADLADGYARVLVLSPLGGRSFTPVEWGMHLATQTEALREGGSRVETIFPDSNSRMSFGENMMDPSTRSPAARAGFEQGRAIGGSLVEFWR